MYRSNRLETLVDDLAGILSHSPLRDPVRPEHVVVGSRGMESWLFRQLAQRLGICANLSFSFPAGILDRMMLLLSGASEEGAWQQDLPPDPWKAEALVWGVLACLSQLPSGAGATSGPYRQLLGYLDQDPPGAISRRRYALARRIADVLDRYTLLRPELARGWSKDGGPRISRDLPIDLAWQPLLWAALQKRVGKEHTHLAQRTEQARRKIKRNEKGNLPGLERLTIFGISSLPPQLMRTFAALARLTRINLFLPCPSREYWADLRSAREKVAALRQGEEPGLLQMPREELTRQLRELAWQEERPEGNPLLAACGRIARDFQVVLEDFQYIDKTDEEEAFSDPVPCPEDPSGPPAGALHWIQSDMLAAQHPALRLENPELRRRRDLSPEDQTIQLHACHGPTRQVEVLRELLLGLLVDLPRIEPRHILVMTPDIELYAPLISAVFDSGPDRRLADGTYGPGGGPRLPYRIEDLTLRRTNPVADALLRTMELCRSRMEATVVLELLELEPVRRRFGVDAEDLPRIHGWIQESGIRWGRDSDHRADTGQPRDGGNTWAFGLDRFALGVCMTSMEHRLVAGVAPMPDLEGGEVALLGRFLDFANSLQREVLALGEARPVEDWVRGLGKTVRSLTRTSDRAGWLSRQVIEALEEMKEQAEAAGLTQDVGLAAMSSHLDGRFEVPSGKVSNSRGAVTFCGMMPMRSIPYKVICLLGMDEGAFPRNANQIGFDLTARRSRLGDKDPRDEDRLIFMEAIQSAQEQLVILYSGRDERSGEERDPAVVVDELRDLLDHSFSDVEQEGGAISPSRALTMEHPLQAFSPLNFSGPKPWSFHRGRLEASRRLLQVRAGERAAPTGSFFTGEEAGAGVSLPGGAITMDQLIAFFQQPVAHLLNRGLNLYLGEKDELLRDREPINLDGLEQWAVAAELLRAGAEGASLEAVQRSIKAEGRLPLGNPGTFILEERREVALQTLARHKRQTAGLEPGEATVLDLDLGEERLVGAVTQRFGGLSIGLDMGKVTGKRLVAPWICCLAWSAQHPELAPAVRLVMGRRQDADVHVEVLEFCLRDMTAPEREAKAREQLEQLIGLYRQGMMTPLPLFERSSYCFAEKLDGALTPDDFRHSLAGRLSPDQAKKLRSATAAARRTWEPSMLFPGEGAEAHLQHVFGGRSPILLEEGKQAGGSQVDPVFARLALLFWQPCLEALQFLPERDEQEGRP